MELGVLYGFLYLSFKMIIEGIILYIGNKWGRDFLSIYVFISNKRINCYFF